MKEGAESLDDALAACVQPIRQIEDFWRLVQAPSPTRREREFALLFAEMLATAGAEVEIDETLPDSTSVIGRLEGNRPGRVLQLAGHLDHIDIAHPPPQPNEDNISGRGSADMRCGLAGMLEVVRILKAKGCDFAGQLLVTAYGLHEAPLGDSRGLLNLIDRRILGDAALDFEGSQDRAIVVGKGQSIWKIDLNRSGKVCHELRRNPDADNLLDTVMLVIQRLVEKNSKFAAEKHNYPMLGPQSVFVGQVHYGDFYNRVPRQAFLQGTWRWHPDRSFQEVQGELSTPLVQIPHAENITVEDSWVFVGEAFSFNPNERIVHALREAYSSVTGKTMELAGSSSILDVNRLVPFGKTPAVSISLDGERAHADYEVVRLERMVMNCKVALLAVLNYLNRES